MKSLPLSFQVLLFPTLIRSFTIHNVGHVHPPPSLHTALSATSAPPNTAGTYSANQITVLEGLDPVRKRPGMYIGSTGPDGLHHLIYEVLDNSVDEALGGHASLISLTLNEDGSCTVSDDGRGIPVETHPVTGVSALETVMTVLHAGGKFESDQGYKVSGGLHGVGISVVNALSEFVEVKVEREGVGYEMRFERGLKSGGMRVGDVNSSEDKVNGDVSGLFGEEVVDKLIAKRKSGTTVTFLPDIKVFKSKSGEPGIEFEVERLIHRMDEIAYLNAGLVLTLQDNRNPKKLQKKVFYHAGGLSEYVALLTNTKTPLIHIPSKKSNSATSSLDISPDGSTILLSCTADDISVSVALRWCSDLYTESILSFCNNIRTKDGGTHVETLKTTLTRTINSLARDGKKNLLKDGKNLPGDFIREGLTAIISVTLPDPEFEGQTKSRLGNPEVRKLDPSLSADLTRVFDFHPKVLERIVEKATRAMNAAAAARAARDLVRRKSSLTSTVLPGKLADCASRDPAASEIFIVEGDSAAGSAKQGRDRRFQAILPLRGKILNIERASAEKIYQNNELQGLISALGLGVRGTELDLKTLRYQKIVIMTDADVDGAHIRALLLTFFYRYQRELIENGFIYIAQPPLYKLVTGKTEKYAYNDQGKDDILGRWTKTNADRKITIQRFKGLGEMMPEQLWSTTMDPDKRVLMRVTLEDCAAADMVLGVLMGDAVAPRREYIVSRAEGFGMADLDV